MCFLKSGSMLVHWGTISKLQVFRRDSHLVWVIRPFLLKNDMGLRDVFIAKLCKAANG